MAKIDLEITTLPGEQIVVKLLELAIEVVKNQPPEVAAKYWDNFYTDYARWRKFWAKIAPDVFVE